MLATQSLLSGFLASVGGGVHRKDNPEQIQLAELVGHFRRILGRRWGAEVAQQFRLDFNLRQTRFPRHVNVHVDGLHGDTLRRVRDCSALWAMIRYAETCCLDEVRSIYEGYCQKVKFWKLRTS